VPSADGPAGESLSEAPRGDVIVDAGVPKPEVLAGGAGLVKAEAGVEPGGGASPADAASSGGLVVSWAGASVVGVKAGGDEAGVSNEGGGPKLDMPLASSSLAGAGSDASAGGGSAGGGGERKKLPGSLGGGSVAVVASWLHAGRAAVSSMAIARPRISDAKDGVWGRGMGRLGFHGRGNAEKILQQPP